MTETHPQVLVEYYRAYDRAPSRGTIVAHAGGVYVYDKSWILVGSDREEGVLAPSTLVLSDGPMGATLVGTPRHIVLILLTLHPYLDGTPEQIAQVIEDLYGRPEIPLTGPGSITITQADGATNDYECTQLEQVVAQIEAAQPNLSFMSPDGALRYICGVALAVVRAEGVREG